ncbi:MAG: hypothetical protein NTX81_10565 [Candidatus Bathyarchaeota archaeon]|nr:hypothetical protein [Candidatus Bathyarchaeota archaeon]
MIIRIGIVIIVLIWFLGPLDSPGGLTADISYTFTSGDLILNLE